MIVFKIWFKYAKEYDLTYRMEGMVAHAYNHNQEDHKLKDTLTA